MGSKNSVKEIEKIVRLELKKKYKDKRLLERIVSVDKYNSLPITSAKNENELPVILRDVAVVVKQKIIDNKDIILAYEVYDEQARKILETMDDGRIKLDREIMDDKLKDMLAKIKSAGYEPAGMDSLDEKGNIDSFFQIINEKVIAINKEQKELLDKSDDREQSLLDISKRALDPQKAGSDKSYSVLNKNETHALELQKAESDKEKSKNKKALKEDAKVSNKNDAQVKQELEEEHIDAVKITKEIEDPIFKRDNNHIEGARGVLTRDGRIEIVKEENGKLKKAEEFKNSTAKRGETFVAWNDEENIGDQEHTYGEIEGKEGNKKYSITLDKYGDPELLEKRRNVDGHMEQNEEYVSMGVHTKGDAYYKANREGEENSNNITTRARDTKSTNRDQHYNGSGTGKGGIHEIARANKKHLGAKDYTMDDFSAHTNPKLDDAIGKFHDELKKNGISLDPDVEANVEKRIAEYVEQAEKPFCDEEAKAYVMDAQIEMRAKLNPQEKEEAELSEESNEKDRVRADEAAEARRRGVTVTRRNNRKRA